jgi:hypothetical protein
MMRPAVPLSFIVPGTTLVGAVVAGALVGIEVSLLVIAGGALVGVIALLWASVQSLTGESPLTLEEALSLGAPSAEEEQKRAVLRALKDLEFERSVGKITQEDYVELSNRYRTEARRLIHLLDAGGEKERAAIEQILAERLAAKESKVKQPRADADGTPAPSRAEASGAPESEEKQVESEKSEPEAAPKAVERGSA